MGLLEFLEKLFDFVDFRQNLGNGATSAGGGVGPELLQSFGQLLSSHYGLAYHGVGRLIPSNTELSNPHPALRADLSRRERYVHQELREACMPRRKRRPDQYEEGYERYGMYSDDWRHLDDYWRNLYGAEYPDDRESNRHYEQAFDMRRRPGGWARWMAGANPYNPFDAPGQYSGVGPKNYKRSDERILEDVNEQLTRHHLIDASDIEASVNDGEVTLRGSVAFRQTKRLAEDIAANITGVTDVRNELRVQQRTPRRSDDRAA